MRRFSFKRATRLAQALVACAPFFPAQAFACATCGFADPSTPYYLKMILFMTSIPVLFVLGVVLYLRRKAGQNAADD